ncbi:Lysine-specific demethylase 3A [Armadillidium vulgare]|nr:Lysine-specific demethylase 3A [Armadillidium vulgare]
MDRERAERRKERERRDRDERERSRRAEWSSEADLQLVNKHFEESFRYASQKLGRENLRQMPPSENHPASVYYSQGLTSQQTAPTHLTHPPSLLISQQPTSQSTSQSQQQTQNKNFQPHSQKGSPWSQNIGNLSLKVDGRDHRQQPPPRHQPTSQQSNESIRKVKEPEQFVKESIYNAFRSTDDPNNDPQMKSHNPPPAHSKHPSDKSSPNLPGYPVPFSLKEHKPHGLDRSSYPIPPSHEKASVIVQPDLKYDKVAQHSVSPKQRPPERSSPYSAQPPAQGPNHYKPYEPTTPNRAPSAIHHSSSLSPSPHNVELTKARQPLSSPHAVQPSAASNERYYSSGTKPPVSSPYQLNLASGGLLQNHLHNINTLPVKSKVSSPPLQMYGKPGITSGAPVCKIDTRPNPQPLPLTSKAPTLNGPPPAHLGSRNHDARPPPTPHEQRVSHNRSPFDTRHYPGSGVSHPKTVTTSVVSTHPTPRIPPTSSPHVMSGHHSPHPPTQTQPLDLGTRDGSNSSPTARRRSLTPTPQETKRPRLDNVSPSPMLSRVSEPSPLYPTAATTITTVENTVAFAKLQRVSSPVVSNAQSSVVSSNITKSSSVITNSPSNSTFPSNSNTPETANSSVPVTVSRPSSQPPPSASPVALTNANRTETSSPPNSKQLEPEKCSSPGPAGSAGNVYVHKLKKAWLQRHTSGAEPSPSNHSNGSNNNSSGSNSSSSTGSTSASSCSISPAKSSSPIAASKPDSKTPLRKVKPLPGLPNGHGQEGKEMDSTSTDSDDSNSPKMKRMKTKRNLKRMKKGSESNSDSDKESDGSEESIKKAGNLPMKQDIEPRRRRGRKPKIKPEKEDLLKVKRSKDDTPNDPLQKPPVSQLKKTGESFLQDRSCYEVAPKLPKCRECRWTAQQRNKKMPNIFCRFYAFRRLRYTKNGQLAVAGFSDPVKDAYGEDLRLWVPDLAAPASDLDCEMSKFLLTHVGDQFCDLVQQENEAMALHMGEDPVVAWKRVVQGVREMCDVCETTLFNIHWACSKCGFVVCIDCYKGRKEGTVKVWDVDEGAKERDKYSWLLCASRVPHELDKLMLTQIIAGNALADLGNKIHEWRYKWGVPMYCGCSEASKYKEKEQEDKKLNGINKDLIKNIKKESKSDLVNGTVKLEKGERINGKDDDMSNSPLNFFADVALSNDKRESESSNSDSDSDSDGKDGQPSTLRELLTVRSSSKSSVIGKEDSSTTSKSKEPSKKKAKLDTLDDVISCVIERDVDKDNKKDPMKVELKHFIRKYNYNRKGKEPLPIRIMTKTESRLLYPNVPHSWLCDGKLLRLHDPLHKDNVTIFQDQWKRGQPVIVSGTGQNLDSDLWKPQSFAKDFGEAKNNLINCLTDNIVPNQPMKKFWEGFEHYGKRLKDEKGQPMVLKLKDWPPTDDFAEMLPRRFNDLMRILPMGEYTRRNGSLNLAGRLPECFVRPDLGPKMYIAYGSVSYPSKASTNLHLDISDAVNVMCYVGVPKDVEYEENMRGKCSDVKLSTYLTETLKAIDDAGCDILTRQRVREKEEVPGALWHIYHARDADKIRDLLNKVAIERGKKLEPFHDPIHDQSWYLDGPLRERLYKEYAVEGYAIVQCMGDAVFIPAGAPTPGSKSSKLREGSGRLCVSREYFPLLPPYAGVPSS